MGVDLAAARDRGIAVANVPATGNNADSVAELVIMLTIALLRNLPEAQANIRAGRLGAPQGRMLASRTICLYGLGAIAKALAKRLRPFDVRLIGITRDPHAAKVAEFNLDACYSLQERDACLAQTDVLILCSRLSSENKGSIDASALRALRPGTYLVNAARALVDYDALRAALITVIYPAQVWTCIGRSLARPTILYSLSQTSSRHPTSQALQIGLIARLPTPLRRTLIGCVTGRTFSIARPETRQQISRDR